MEYNDYVKQGFSIIQCDDNVLDWFDKLEAQLKPHGLKIEYAEETCDGFEPFRIVKRQKNS